MVLALSNQLRPFYRYELMHVRAACGLSKEQLQKIRPESDAAYDEAIASLEAARMASPRSTGDDEPDYHEAIRKAVHSVARRHVSREQWDALQADLRLRAASRKDAAIDLLVAVLDRDLLLTGRQRQEISATVAAHWEERFIDPLEVAFNDQSRCPKIPDELVDPVLERGPARDLESHPAPPGPALGRHHRPRRRSGHGAGARSRRGDEPDGLPSSARGRPPAGPDGHRPAQRGGRGARRPGEGGAAPAPSRCASCDNPPWSSDRAAPGRGRRARGRAGGRAARASNNYRSSG